MSVLHQQIGQWLGIRTPKSEQQVLEIVEQQLPTSAINRLLAVGLTRAEIDGLVIPLRTLQHRRSRREKLTVDESDRVLRVARVLSQAEAVYGSRERALEWLRRPHPRLNKRMPLEMSRTDTGSRIVEELLVQIDEGHVRLITLWRISQHSNLQGDGGLRAPGRWHERGLPVVYLAESPSGALLEACVHTSANDVPPHYRLLEVEAEDDVSIDIVDVKSLIKDWAKALDKTRDLGSTWLRSGASALLRIPSALVPSTFNVMLNPLHPDAKRVRIKTTTKYPFDPRIKK